jgi:hypothetical protein
MNNAFVLAAVVFALVGTLVFAAIAPYLYEVDAQPVIRKPVCPEQSPLRGSSPPCGPGMRTR